MKGNTRLATLLLKNRTVYLFVSVLVLLFFFAWNVEFCPCLCFIFMLIFRALFFCESFRLVWISKFFVIEFCSAWGALQLEFIRHAELFWWALLIGNLHSNVIRTGLACSRGQHVYTNSNRSHLKWITFCSFLLR